MNETSKSHPVRERRRDYEIYLRGKGIDIGAGGDMLSVPLGEVMYWDQPQGDAQLLESVTDASLDFVYSSHCLEHLPDLRVSLANWARVLRPQGYAYIVVPDYTLYEQHRWPSAYNGDHKQSFSLWLDRTKVRRDNHWHIHGADFDALIRGAGLKLIEAEIQDDGFDYGAGCGDQTMGMALAQILVVLQKNLD